MNAGNWSSPSSALSATSLIGSGPKIGVGKVTNKRTVSPRHAPSFTYSVSNRQALALLRQVVPFLRSYKRIRAGMAVDHYVSVTPRNGKYNRAQDAARTQFETDFLAVKAGSTAPAN